MERHGGILNACCLVKEANRKAILCMISIWHGKAKTGDRKEIRDCQGLGVGVRRRGGTHRIFRTVKLFCYDTIMVDVSHPFVKTLRMFHRNPNINYGL